MTLFYFVFCIAYNHVAGAFESRALFFIAKNDCGNSITRQNIGLWMLVMFTRWGQSTLTISREKKYSKQHSSVCIVCENTKSNRNETVANVAVCVFYIFFLYIYRITDSYLVLVKYPESYVHYQSVQKNTHLSVAVAAQTPDRIRMGGKRWIRKKYIICLSFRSFFFLFFV